MSLPSKILVFEVIMRDIEGAEQVLRDLPGAKRSPSYTWGVYIPCRVPLQMGGVEAAESLYRHIERLNPPIPRVRIGCSVYWDESICPVDPDLKIFEAYAPS